jgi:hypothetical protein
MKSAAFLARSAPMNESNTTATGEPEVSAENKAGSRRLAMSVYRWSLLVFLAAGVVQIFLAGLGAFRLLHGDGDSALDPHRTLGFTMGGMALIVLILALIARAGVRAISLAVLLVVLTSFMQSLLAGLADNHVIFGAFHAADGLLILAIPAYLYFWSARPAQ